MKRTACLTVLLTIGFMPGCVERRYVINSDPPGALVYLNGNYLGATPVDGYITYYGKQNFTLVKDGYETLQVLQSYPAPWYELPGIDFITENVWPFKVRDVRCFHYTMQPLQTVRPDDVRQRAEDLRSRGQTIGVPREPRPASPGTAAPPGATLGGPTPSSPSIPAAGPPVGGTPPPSAGGVNGP